MVTAQQIRQRYAYSVILLRQLVIADFKLRYQGSILGYVWSLLRPLLIFAVLYTVFTIFLPLGKGVHHYPVYLFVGIVLWNYFNEVTSGSVGAIVGKGDLLRKINFPKYVVVLAVSMSGVINLFFNSIVVMIFMYFNHVGVGIRAFLIIPIIIELFILGIGFGFLLSALFVKFRDVSYIWEVILQAAFYATPILYPLQTVFHAHHKVAQLLILNPMAQIIQAARNVLLSPAESLTPSQLYPGKLWAWLLPIGSVFFVATLGAIYFRRRSKFFAEEV